MISMARVIADMCCCEEVSDEQISSMSEEYYNEYGFHWSEILN